MERSDDLHGANWRCATDPCESYQEARTRLCHTASCTTWLCIARDGVPLPFHPIASTSTLRCPFCRLFLRLSCRLCQRLSGWENLNSLRIDPIIVSVIDQFTHICLFRLHEGKWQKRGFKDAFFCFERYLSYPRHGLFVLNRAGVNDYIYPIHPEDEIRVAEEEYLMYPFYPKFTTNGPSSPPWSNRPPNRSSRAGRPQDPIRHLPTIRSPTSSLLNQSVRMRSSYPGFWAPTLNSTKLCRYHRATDDPHS